MLKNILITRTKPGAFETASRLKMLGFLPHVCSLTQILPNPFVWPQKPYDGILFSSTSVFNYIHSDIPSLLNTPTYIIGKKTNDMALLYGFKNIQYIALNSVDLNVYLHRTITKKTKLIHFTGVVRNAYLNEQFKNHLLQIVAVEVYNTQPLEHSTYFENLNFTIHAVLLYSASGAAYIKKIKNYLNEKTHFYCLSKRIADCLPTDLKNRIFISNAPTEKALLKLLTDTLS